jgi:hypothetical protein
MNTRQSAKERSRAVRNEVSGSRPSFANVLPVARIQRFCVSIVTILAEWFQFLCEIQLTEKSGSIAFHPVEAGATLSIQANQPPPKV